MDDTPTLSKSDGHFFKAVTPDGRWVVTVDVHAWRFECAVTLDNTTCVETLRTTDENVMLRWVKNQMQEAMRRSS